MEAVNQIQLYSVLFYISLAVTLVGLGLAVFFFFYFDIRNVRAIMTGSAKQKEIEKLNKRNAMTGKLTTDSLNMSGHLTGQTGPIGPVIQNPAPANSGASETTVLAPDSETTETTILTPDSGSAETSVLSPDDECPTAILGAAETGHPAAAAAPQQPAPRIRFEVTQSVMEIHTNEYI